MTALLIAYFLGWRAQVSKAIWCYLIVAGFFVIGVQFNGINAVYAQEHQAATSSITQEDIDNAYGNNNETTNTGSNETTTGEQEVLAAKTVVDELDELIALASTYETSDAYRGNNLEFYKLLRDRFQGKSPASQAKTFANIVSALRALDQETFNLYGLHKAGLLSVLSDIAERQLASYPPSSSKSEAKSTKTTPKAAAKRESINHENLDITYTLYYGRTEATVGFPIVFTLAGEGNHSIQRATWRFSKSDVRTCEWRQCQRISVSYDEPGKHEVILLFKYGNGQTGRYIFTIDVASTNLTKKSQQHLTLQSTVIDVMKMHGTSDTKTSVGDSVNAKKTTPIDTTSDIDSKTRDDKENNSLDDEFESLILSIFGQ